MFVSHLRVLLWMKDCNEGLICMQTWWCISLYFTGEIWAYILGWVAMDCSSQLTMKMWQAIHKFNVCYFTSAELNTGWWGEDICKVKQDTYTYVTWYRHCGKRIAEWIKQILLILIIFFSPPVILFWPCSHVQNKITGGEKRIIRSGVVGCRKICLLVSKDKTLLAQLCSASFYCYFPSNHSTEICLHL